MFSLPTLSIGDVPVTIRPLQDRASLEALVAVIEQIRGVDRVDVEGFADGESRLTVHLDRPTAFAGELRAALYRTMIACTVEDGVLAVVLTGPPAPSSATGTTPRRTPAPAPSWTTGDRDAAQDGDDVLIPMFADLTTRAAAAKVINELGNLSILTFDRDQRFTAGAGALRTRLGRGFELLRGRLAADVVRPAVWPTLRPGYDAAVAGHAATIDFVGVGGESISEASFSPLVDDDGSLIGGMVIARDVTDARRNGRLVDELTDVLRVTFDHSPTGQALLSPAGRWVRVNGALQELLGVGEPQLVTRTLQDITHAEDRAAEARLLAELAAGTRDRYVLAKRFVHADGHAVPVNATTTLLRGSDGTPHGLVCQITGHPA